MLKAVRAAETLYIRGDTEGALQSARQLLTTKQQLREGSAETYAVVAARAVAVEVHVLARRGAASDALRAATDGLVVVGPHPASRLTLAVAALSALKSSTMLPDVLRLASTEIDAVLFRQQQRGSSSDVARDTNHIRDVLAAACSSLVIAAASSPSTAPTGLAATWIGDRRLQLETAGVSSADLEDAARSASEVVQPRRVSALTSQPAVTEALSAAAPTTTVGAGAVAVRDRSNSGWVATLTSWFTSPAGRAATVVCALTLIAAVVARRLSAARAVPRRQLVL
jgi:hypothetical protein